VKDSAKEVADVYFRTVVTRIDVPAKCLGVAALPAKLNVGDEIWFPRHPTGEA
jgi:hypothetical protein